MRYALETSSGPASEPRTLAEAKSHLHVTASGENTYITALIKTARQVVEDYTGRALMDRQVKLYLDAFPDGDIVMPLPPLQSVTSIVYLDTDGASQTLATGYRVDNKSARGRISPAYGTTWPSTREVSNAVTVTARVGVTSAANAPQPLLQAMDLLYGQYFTFRENVQAGAPVSAIPMAAKWLMDPYVSHRFNGLE